MTEAPKFTQAKVELVGNGYIITCSDGELEASEQQFVARDLSQVCEVLQAVMAPPPEVGA